jgi:divalent metal cation (Fe/Co/Zn/Cd) transporter
LIFSQVLFALKIGGAVLSKSLSVISSVIDSAVDLTSSLILFWAWRAIKNRDKYRYPQGRTRLEPVAIIILSVIMCAASVLVVYESINTVVSNAQYFTETNTTKTLSEIDMSAFPISVMVITTVSKSILFFLCCRVKTPTMSALSADHRNDVFSNLVALSCGLIGRETFDGCDVVRRSSLSGSFAYRRKIDPRAIFVDPIGAILISFYIIFTWIRQANSEWCFEHQSRFHL